MNALWDYITSHQSQLVFDSYQHVSAVIQSVIIATVIGVVIGLLTYSNDIASNLATSISSAVLTVPSFALLGLLIPLVGLGVIPSITALVLYSLLPIIRNTIVGMNNIEPALIDAARGIGMGRVITLVRVELPLVWPAILAGMRLSTQMAMGVLAIAAYVKGPGLGNLIFAGLARVGSPTAVPMALSGTLLIVILALVLDALYVLLGRLTTSKGIR
ncbi:MULTISPECIES: ABC transporter permease [Mycobacteriales]|uniref:ABC transporter permease n=1 Tax=Gordonia rubripertincta TaxID=36822 RepID=A0ABT4N0J9_GORRU|nr:MULTISPECIES: ABC transporter permease [Mycobacteriales]MBA4022047.1 ABC transporter permease [Gordonia sp. (in: high G+C Gram-positive bacteria)]MCZ4552794.1 ABC transporter permease [Gordonia rubripertincta]ORM26106.1 ABC transporter permease [Williamsia sp. 1135]OZG27128.1 ABC transporter permease [Williamsia sp. 1138]